MNEETETSRRPHRRQDPLHQPGPRKISRVWEAKSNSRTSGRRWGRITQGEVAAIDVDSDGRTMGDNVIATRDRLRAQRPEAVDVWLLRVGYRRLHHFGGGPLWSAG